MSEYDSALLFQHAALLEASAITLLLNQIRWLTLVDGSLVDIEIDR